MPPTAALRVGCAGSAGSSLHENTLRRRSAATQTTRGRGRPLRKRLGTNEAPPAIAGGAHRASGFGWRGRIRTFDLLIQSQAPYRLATRQWTGLESRVTRPSVVL